MYKVYARSSDGYFVDKFFSTFYEKETKGDFLIKEGNSIDCIHVQYNVYDNNMCHNYKIVNNILLETSVEDKENEINNRPIIPSETDIMNNKIILLESENKLLKEITKEQDQLLVDNTYKITMLEMTLGGI